jgi:glutathione S-transferase
MKLYSSPFSPFSARVRAQIRLKQLPIAIEPPPGGLRTAEYRSVNPTGKVPALVLDDGCVLPESIAILEYLEDLHPAPGLRPSDLHARGQMRAMIQITDHILGPATFPLFGAVRGNAVEAQAAAHAIDNTLAALLPFTRIGPWLLGAEISLADVVLAPTMYYVIALPLMAGAPIDLAKHGALAAWWASVCAQPALRETLLEVDAGFRAFAAGLGRDPSVLGEIIPATTPRPR